MKRRAIDYQIIGTRNSRLMFGRCRCMIALHLGRTVRTRENVKGVEVGDQMIENDGGSGSRLGSERAKSPDGAIHALKCDSVMKMMLRIVLRCLWGSLELCSCLRHCKDSINVTRVLLSRQLSNFISPDQCLAMTCTAFFSLPGITPSLDR